MKKCVLWGIGKEYEKILNQILFETEKGNIKVMALVCREFDRYSMQRDGYDVITKNELMYIDYDYLIITSSLFYEDIKKEAKELGIEDNKIISGEVFLLPLFDFSLYVNLIENPVTILSDDCWGGFVYHRLRLLFTSPLVNTAFERDEYAKFILDPLFYLNTDLTLYRDGNVYDGLCPIGYLGDGKRKVFIHFVHDRCFKEIKEKWDRRIKRINKKNLFVKMGFSVCDVKNTWLESFKSVNQNKVLFYFGETDIDEAFKTDRFIWLNRKGSVVYEYNSYIRNNYYYDLDLLKLLNGKADYKR